VAYRKDIEFNPSFSTLGFLLALAKLDSVLDSIRFEAINYSIRQPTSNT
jgi:hypothetical protein